jgi:hypothetical protein
VCSSDLAETGILSDRSHYLFTWSGNYPNNHSLTNPVSAAVIKWYIEQHGDMPSKAGPGKDIKLLME